MANRPLGRADDTSENINQQYRDNFQNSFEFEKDFSISQQAFGEQAKTIQDSFKKEK